MKKIGLFCGRFQPFHDGHLECVKEILKTHETCVIAIRDTEISSKDPLTMEERLRMIASKTSDLGMPVEIIEIPDIDTIFIGRDVGYDLIKLSKKLEKISGTNIRNKMYGDSKKNV